MKRMLLAGAAGLSCLALLAVVLPAAAMMIAPPPVPQRVATADVVVVGKVTAFGDKTVSALPIPGAREKVEYQVAVVRIDDALVGAKDQKEIRVGFRLPPPAVAPPPPPPGGGPVRIGPIRKWREPSLVLGQEAMLFLVKHPEADFYVMPAYFSVIDKKGPNFANDLAEVQKAARLLADPKAGLESKNADERLLTAGLLISRYRTQRPGPAPKTEPIDAAQSKLILQVLADADWKAAPRPGLMNQLTSPQALFFRLGLQARDGWTPPRDFKELPEAAKKWLKDNADTYRIERFVAAEKTEKTDKKD
jgi:hypothetical protein